MASGIVISFFLFDEKDRKTPHYSNNHAMPESAANKSGQCLGLKYNRKGESRFALA
jgi:hypothetical protein